MEKAIKIKTVSKPKIYTKTLDKEKNKISIEEKIRNIKNFSIIKS